MTDLEQAIETITEGGQALGVSCEDVYQAMLADDDFAMKMMELIHEWNSCVDFRKKFESCARELLKEALRTEKEQEAGL
ncbi:MAG: hypothetical protein ABJG42_24670 [Vibrio splendidus]